MSARFHIEELISQDSSGVIFRAHDLESGRDVTVRRFFPRGMGEGGLKEEERSAFEIAVQRAACAAHPALRSVIAGGCDPVDGIPFVVTEWLDGDPISQRLAAGPLPQRRAVDIVMGALEVSEVISELLAEQAVWVETDPTAIIETSGDSNRGTTFGISPLKWLGTNEERRSLKPIAQLTEELMGWKNKLINDQAGNGLATWLKWLKQNASQATLAQAREALATATGAPPPPPTSRLVRQSTRPMAPRAATVQVTAPITKPKKRSMAPVVLSVVGLAIVLGAGGWMVKTGEIPFKKRFTSDPAASTTAPGRSALDIIAQSAAESPVETDSPEPEPSTAASAAPAASTPTSGKIYQVAEAGQLLKMLNQIVNLEGKVEKVYYNKEKTQIFLEFAASEGKDACGYVIPRDATGPMSFDELQKLVGKTIRIRGQVAVGKGNFGDRPKIQLTKPESITMP